MKTLFIDCETTGVDPFRHGLIQMAGIITDGATPLSGPCETFNFRIRPFPQDEIEDSALEVNQISRETLESFEEPREVYRQFTKLLELHVNKYNRADKFIWIGYNARFDMDMVRAWFGKLGDKYFGSWFWFPAIDVMNLAATVLISRRHTLENFRLATVAQAMGLVVPENMHDAMADIQLTADLYAETRAMLAGYSTTGKGVDRG